MTNKVALITGVAPVAVITGGSRGIGLGIARRLADEGWSLVINGKRSPEDVEPALQELSARGASTLYVRGDISLTETRTRLVEEAVERFNRIDALVNNAGITSVGRLDYLEATEDSFDQVITTNLKAPYFLSQIVARQMIDQGMDEGFRYKIVNISSVNATVVSLTRGDYCISKAGLAIASKVMAARLAEFGIDCFEVRPGIIATDMTAGVKEKYDKLIADGLTFDKRWGTPDDLGSVVATVLRGDLPYSTGQVLVVDGGLTIDIF
jgi:3-oxoacyl-[acyl-carrier protein] reductase